MNRTSPSAHEYWRQIIQRQQSSGLSVARFCQEQQIAPSSLFAWKRRLAREAQTGAAPAFVRVEPASIPQADTAMGPSHGAVELHLGRGRHLLLRPGFDAQTLAAALAVLAGEVPQPEAR